MSTTIPILSYWYYHLPNFLLAALMYTLLGRVLLSLFVDPDSPNYIWRFFCRVDRSVRRRSSRRDAEGGGAGRRVAVRVRVAVLAARLLLYVFLVAGAGPRIG